MTFGLDLVKNSQPLILIVIVVLRNFLKIRDADIWGNYLYMCKNESRWFWKEDHINILNFKLMGVYDWSEFFNSSSPWLSWFYF